MVTDPVADPTPAELIAKAIAWDEAGTEANGYASWENNHSCGMRSYGCCGGGKDIDRKVLAKLIESALLTVLDRTPQEETKDDQFERFHGMSKFPDLPASLPTGFAIGKTCQCQVPDPVMQAGHRFYCYTCSLQRPAQLCVRCQSIVLAAAPSPLETLRSKIVEFQAGTNVRAEVSNGPGKHRRAAERREVETIQRTLAVVLFELDALLPLPPSASPAAKEPR